MRPKMSLLECPMLCPQSLHFHSPTRVKHAVQTDIVAVARLQTFEDNRRYDRHDTQPNQGLVYPVNHLGPDRECASGTKNAVASPAAATPKLIDICCMVLAMELALLVCCFGDIGIDQRIHARVLQRSETSIAERLQRRSANRRAPARWWRRARSADAENHGVGDQHAAVAECAPECRGMIIFMLMAAIACGMISRPD